MHNRNSRRLSTSTLLTRMLSVFLGLILVLTIGAIVYIATTDNPGKKITEFYILGLDGKAENYPGVVELGSSGTVIIGIVNHEYETVNYLLETHINGEVTDETGPITLSQGEKWEHPVSFTPVTIGEKQKVEFILYKNNKDNQYLKLNLWIDVEKG